MQQWYTLYQVNYQGVPSIGFCRQTTLTKSTQTHGPNRCFVLPSVPIVSSVCFTCSDIILLIDIRLSVMLLLVSTRLSLVAFLRQKTHTKQNRWCTVAVCQFSENSSSIQSSSNNLFYFVIILYVQVDVCWNARNLCFAWESVFLFKASCFYEQSKLYFRNSWKWQLSKYGLGCFYSNKETVPVLYAIQRLTSQDRITCNSLCRLRVPFLFAYCFNWLMLMSYLSGSFSASSVVKLSISKRRVIKLRHTLRLQESLPKTVGNCGCN